MGDAQRRVLAALTVLAGGTAASLPFYHGAGLAPSNSTPTPSTQPAQVGPVVPLQIAGDHATSPLATSPTMGVSTSARLADTLTNRPADAPRHARSPDHADFIDEIQGSSPKAEGPTEIPTPSLSARRPAAEEDVPPATLLRRSAEPGLSPATAEPPRIRVHRITDGDTLETLAERFLGDRSRWPEIRDANRQVLASDDILPIGKSLQIPPRERATTTEASATSSPGPAAPPSDRPGLVPIEWK